MQALILNYYSAAAQFASGMAMFGTYPVVITVKLQWYDGVQPIITSLIAVSAPAHDHFHITQCL